MSENDLKNHKLHHVISPLNEKEWWTKLDIELSRPSFSEDDSDVILLINADNAFDPINWNVMLHSIWIICRIIAIYIINSYSQEARFYISGDEQIISCKGTT